MRRPATSRTLLAATLVTATLAGCTAGPSTRPEVISNDGPAAPASAGDKPGVPLPPLEEPKSPTIKWTDCDEETRARIDQPAALGALKLSCARVAITVDAPDLPNRGLSRMSVLKVGTGSIPLVVVNDIDGDPGTLFAAKLAATAPPELLAKFSLIGVDRRGSGQSTPAQCIPGNVRSDLLDQDPAAESGIEAVLDAARKAGQQCAIELDTNQTALDSWRAAGDLDQLREELGMSKLNALGHGEGSRVLTGYSVRFPSTTGRIVLDGAPDPGPDTAAALDAVAAGLQSTVDGFAKDCAQRKCALGDASAVLTSVVDKMRKNPSPDAGAGIALYAISSGLAQRARWPELADALGAANAGDVSKLTAFIEPMLSDTRVRPSRLDGALATKCNDSATRLPTDQIQKLAQTMRTKYPLFGGLVAQQLAWCSPWPVRREPLPPAGTPNVPPVLVITTANDPVTPLAGTTKVADQFPTSVRIGWQGTGHGAFTFSPCVTDAARAFLIDGKIPANGTLCPS
ncbi:TAP-like protein [Amycolatopsis xylanica]|uniref:TAP-like protein n=1 Tax=Amycolatopsis xylanica TaxID=589385 RepID=A0A1H3J229_9PSEU|nr:alpha/beta hydrolase [Amycolatopsis xylanica]SDY34060.1 TAP-like protein [Amycolatopsis xylanica]